VIRESKWGRPEWSEPSIRHGGKPRGEFERRSGPGSKNSPVKNGGGKEASGDAQDPERIGSWGVNGEDHSSPPPERSRAHDKQVAGVGEREPGHEKI